jgi:hypothetical protein
MAQQEGRRRNLIGYKIISICVSCAKNVVAVGLTDMDKNILYAMLDDAAKEQDEATRCKSVSIAADFVKETSPDSVDLIYVLMWMAKTNRFPLIQIKSRKVFEKYEFNATEAKRLFFLQLDPELAVKFENVDYEMRMWVANRRKEAKKGRKSTIHSVVKYCIRFRTESTKQSHHLPRWLRCGRNYLDGEHSFTSWETFLNFMKTLLDPFRSWFPLE